MKVNLDKTKVMLFRNGGKTAERESFYYLGKEIDIDLYNRYLGLILSSRNVWSKTVAKLAAQVDKALTLIKQFIWKFGYFIFQRSFKICDCRILPLLCYALKFGGASTGMMPKESRQVFANLLWESDDPSVQQQPQGNVVDYQ